MPPEYSADQAEGLRRMLLRDSARMVMVTAAQNGLGVTSVVANLATALSQAGKNVLVLDENPPQHNSVSMLGLNQRYDLLDAVQYGKTWREVVLHSRQGVRVLPIARAIRSLPQLSRTRRGYLLDCLVEASNGAEIVLVDSAPCTGASVVSAALAPGQPLLLVLNATAAAITRGYAFIKRLAALDNRVSFVVAINKARDEQEALTVFENVEQVARHHLRVHVEYLGFIPVDEKLKRAAQLRRPVVEVFPGAAASFAFEEIGHNLMLLPSTGSKDAANLPDVVQQLLVRRSRPPDIALAVY